MTSGREAAPERPQSDAVHTMFSLSYANYLVLNRSLLQSMPDEWQEQFVALIDALDDAYRDLDKPDSYMVRARRGGQFVTDPVPHYNRGRTFVPPSAPARQPSP